MTDCKIYFNNLRKLPPYNFFGVFVALAEEPYEQMHLALPRLLMLKTLFLLAAVSASHILEIMPLCIDLPFLLESLVSLY